MKISEILYRAANERLSVDGFNGHTRSGHRTWAFSCCAAAQAEGCCTRTGVDLSRSRAVGYLYSLGCPDTHAAFSEFDSGETRQGARFLWLDFAALVAEDKGL